jgi:hypothetical protein
MIIDEINSERIQTVLEILINYPNAKQTFLEIADKAVSIERIYYDLAYGTTPALFVIYKTVDDEYLERIRFKK